MSNTDDFVIINNILVKYEGHDKNVIIPDGITQIGKSSFYSNKNIITVVIPDSVSSIDEYAFAYCDCLKDIVIPNSIKSIGYRAFWYCSSLESIALPDSITYLGDDAFADCEKLKNAMIPEGFTLINSTTFSRCGMLCDANGLNIINNVIYNRTNWDKKENLLPIIIPEGVTKIRDNVFAFNSFVNNITLPDSIIDIGQHCFEECKYLQNVIFPNHKVGVQSDAFSKCPKLEHMTIHIDSLQESLNMFGSSGKTIEMTLLNGDKPSRKVIAVYRKDYWDDERLYPNEYMIPTAENLLDYDNLVANGSLEDFKIKDTYRLKAIAYRFAEREYPISEEHKKLFAAQIADKFSKFVKIAESENNPQIVIAAIEAGAITEENRKKAINALKKSSVDGIKELVDRIDDIIKSN